MSSMTSHNSFVDFSLEATREHVDIPSEARPTRPVLSSKNPARCEQSNVGWQTADMAFSVGAPTGQEACSIYVIIVACVLSWSERYRYPASLCLLALWHLHRCYITEGADGSTAIREGPSDPSLSLPKLLEIKTPVLGLLWTYALLLKSDWVRGGATNFETRSDIRM